MADPEVDAMSGVADAMSGIDDDARSRVLRWAAEKYGVAVPHSMRNDAAAHQARASRAGTEADDGEDEVSGGSPTPSANGTAPSTSEFSHFAELFDAVGPKSDLEKAMTAAYWEQVICGKNDWQSSTLNRELKNLGHQVTVINRALTSGIRKKPALVLQLKKSGTTQQGRKTYKLSTEGLKFVQARIAQSG